MEKYTLTRLRALFMASVLTATLSSCGKKSQNIAVPNFKRVFESSFGVCFNTLGRMTTDELNKLIEEKQKEEEKSVTVDDVLASFEDASFNEETKSFLKEFLNANNLNQDVLKSFIEASEEDRNYFALLLDAGLSHFPFGFNEPLFNEVINNLDLQLFDNRKGIIPDAPNTYIQLVRVEQLDNYNVYRPFNMFLGIDKACVITDLDNKIIAHTYNGYVEIEGKKFQLTNFNWKLKKLGLERMARRNYSIADLKQIQCAISKIYIEGHNSSYIKTSDVIVFDTTKCLISKDIDGRHPYYFLEYVGEDVFNTGGHFYRDILNKNAIAYFDQNGYFIYGDFTKMVNEEFYISTGECEYIEPFSIDSHYFAREERYFYGLNAFLINEGRTELVPGKYTTSYNIMNICREVTESFLSDIVFDKDSLLAL